MQIGMGEKNSSPLTEYFLYATYFHHLTRVMFMANLWVRFYCFFSHLTEREIKAQSDEATCLKLYNVQALCPCSRVSYIFLFIFLKLKYSWLTMLCQFLLYSVVTQWYMYSHSFFSYYLPSCSIPRDWIEFPVLNCIFAVSHALQHYSHEAREETT